MEVPGCVRLLDAASSSPGVAWCHQASPGVTRHHLVSPGVTWRHAPDSYRCCEDALLGIVSLPVWLFVCWLWSLLLWLLLLSGSVLSVIVHAHITLRALELLINCEHSKVGLDPSLALTQCLCRSKVVSGWETDPSLDCRQQAWISRPYLPVMIAVVLTLAVQPLLLGAFSWLQAPCISCCHALKHHTWSFPCWCLFFLFIFRGWVVYLLLWIVAIYS